MLYATVSQVYVKNKINYLKATRDDNGVELDQVAILTPMNGFCTVPQVGQQILIGVINQIVQQFVCLGCLYNVMNNPPMQVKSSNSLMRTKYGTGWDLTVDSQSGKEMLTLETAKKDKVLVDQSKRKFLLKSSDGNTKIEMDCNAGTLEISALKKIKISVGSNSIEIDNQGIKINGSMSVKVEASTVDINARAQAKMQGSIVTVKGNMQTSVG